jgi:membrane-bound ClpP family serine protease
LEAGDAHSRRRETVAALLDDVAIAGAASIIIAILMERAGLIGLAGVVALVGGVTGFVALVAVLVYRTHTRRPQVGPESLIGLVGRAVDQLEPGGEGIVEVEGELWRARNASGSKIGRGERVRVVGVRGLTLLVEPATQS